MAEFNLLQNLHLCTQISVCATNFGSLGEIGANFSLQLSSRTQFAKINNKKVIAEIQCEKHKKSSLVSLLANEFDVRSELHGQVSLAAVNQICVIHEAMNSCKNLKIH